MGCTVCGEEGHDGCVDKMMTGVNAVRKWVANELASRDAIIDRLRAENGEPRFTHQQLEDIFDLAYHGANVGIQKAVEAIFEYRIRATQCDE